MDTHRPALDWIDQQVPALTEELMALAAINSGSFNADGVTRVAERLAPRFAALADEVEWIEVAPYRSTANDGSRRERGLGKALRLRKRAGAPLRFFAGGHLDTVFPVDSPFQTARRLGEDRLNGPGVADLKGGLLVLWLALAALERSPQRERIGWELLFNPDEEIGSQSSAPLLREAAGRNHFGLIYEPAYPDGSLASARKGSGNFDVVVRGRAAHAGRDFHAGRNAVVAAAHLVQGLAALNGERGALTLNPAFISGGGPLNIVPDLAVLKFNVRTEAAADEDWLQAQLERLLGELQSVEGITVSVHGGFTRPPKPFDARNQHLAGLIQDCGRALNLPLAFKPTGGCCDGNNLHAYGLPNVDNLGVVGGEIHSDREWMSIPSLAERGKLSALLLLRLANGELSWT
ncbi:MAG TPA: hydrolase [Nevskiaceae bacterium]|nr:hydrolase [Nevskiaceae bacterium]